MSNIGGGGDTCSAAGGCCMGGVGGVKNSAVRKKMPLFNL